MQPDGKGVAARHLLPIFILRGFERFLNKERRIAEDRGLPSDNDLVIVLLWIFHDGR